MERDTYTLNISGVDWEVPVSSWSGSGSGWAAKSSHSQDTPGIPHLLQLFLLQGKIKLFVVYKSVGGGGSPIGKNLGGGGGGQHTLLLPESEFVIVFEEFISVDAYAERHKNQQQAMCVCCRCGGHGWLCWWRCSTTERQRWRWRLLVSW